MTADLVDELHELKEALRMQIENMRVRSQNRESQRRMESEMTAVKKRVSKLEKLHKEKEAVLDRQASINDNIETEKMIPPLRSYQEAKDTRKGRQGDGRIKSTNGKGKPKGKKG